MADIPPFKPISPAAERPSVVKSAVARPAFSGNQKPNYTLSFIRNQISGMSANPSIAKLMAVVAIPKNPEKGFSDRLISVGNTTNDNDFHFSNVTKDAVDLSLLQKSRTTTPKPTTRRAVPPRKASSIGKVMNAPKEYYPVGYDKNFDDNFAARVELPDTSFYCEHQKHFPGLYADEDLGCMVNMVDNDYFLILRVLWH